MLLQHWLGGKPEKKPMKTIPNHLGTISNHSGAQGAEGKTLGNFRNFSESKNSPYKFTLPQ